MKTFRIGLAAALLSLAAPAFAGVEMEMVTKDMAGTVSETVKLLAQGGKIRMEDIGDSSGNNMSMIFIGQEFIVVDHDDQSYVLMDEAMVQELGTKVSAAMEQMKAQLASMPPEQRAMVEQMMQGEMAGLMGDAEDKPAARVDEVGTGSWQSGSCTQYAVFVGEAKTQEVCAAPLGDVAGADEAMQAFEGMAKFINTLSEAMPGPLGASMAENAMGLIEQIDGFPVRTVDYVDGVAASETTLESIAEKSLDEALFTVPEGYRQVDPFAGQ